MSSPIAPVDALLTALEFYGFERSSWFRLSDEEAQLMRPPMPGKPTERLVLTTHPDGKLTVTLHGVWTQECKRLVQAMVMLSRSANFLLGTASDWRVQHGGAA